MFQTDAIRSAQASDDTFERNCDFDLREFANRAFGTFQGGMNMVGSPNDSRPRRSATRDNLNSSRDRGLGATRRIARFEAAGHLDSDLHQVS